MRTFRWVVGVALLSLAIGPMVAKPAAADVTSDRAAAILIWPDIVTSVEYNTDTLVQVSNTSQEAVLLHCFYENANSHCSNAPGLVCSSGSECCSSQSGCGRCVAGWAETDFRVRLTPRQPLGWLASEGLTSFPLTGQPGSTGPDGSSNAGSRVPPVPEDELTGALKCIAINDDGTPSDRNVIKGESTLIVIDEEQPIQVSKHNAVGIQAIQGAVNDDRELVLGGPEPEYNGCANFIILNHFFDLGENPVTGDIMSTRLVLVPCTEDFLRQIPGDAVVQFIVYNEFEQRFSTSRTAECKFESELSLLDTTDPERSVFSAGVAGTLTGQSRLNPIGSGLIAVADEMYVNPKNMSLLGYGRYGRFRFGALASFNVHYQGDRPDPDLITIP